MLPGHAKQWMPLELDLQAMNSWFTGKGHIVLGCERQKTPCLLALKLQVHSLQDRYEVPGSLHSLALHTLALQTMRLKLTGQGHVGLGYTRWWASIPPVLRALNSPFAEQGCVVCTKCLSFSLHSMRLNLSQGRKRGISCWGQGFSLLACWLALGEAHGIGYTPFPFRCLATVGKTLLVTTNFPVFYCKLYYMRIE